ncbi:Stk1 family PASTA domain-containing Ser/Thr kinase [Lachnospiraceae bacterium 46-61]
MLRIGTVLLDRYELLEQIGSGGMAIVFRGKDRTLERYVTVKILREEFIGDEEFIARFRSEALAAARLSHPNIVRVYDVGQEGNVYFIVMEYVHGDTLKQAIKEKAPFDTKSTLNVSMQIASGIAQAHKNHIIHRDIKPQNILVGTDGIIKVTDFGIARAANGATMTTSTTAMGSVHYFSPEQARGGYVDEKSDIYSLGITMFEMVTGQLPFQANTSVAVAMKQINEELPDIRQYNPKVSASLEMIIRKATRKKADERYATIEEMIQELAAAKNETNSVAQQASPRTRTSALQPEIQYLSAVDNNKKQAEARRIEQVRQEELSAAEEMMAKQEKQGIKNIRISKDDDFEREYEEVEPVRRSRRPKLDMQNRRNPRQEEEYEQGYDKTREKKVVFAAVATALIIIAIISAIGVKAFGTKAGLFGESSETAKVKSFVGMELKTAQELAEKDGYRVVEEKSVYSERYAQGIITAQSTEENSDIKKGMEVGVTVSLGKEITEETMPDLKGDKEEIAVEKIKNLIGKEPKVSYEYDEDAEMETVMEQTPSYGTKITAETTISIVVSRGKETKTTIVPKVEGLTQSRAEKALKSSKLNVGDVTLTESNSVEEGIVITQTKEVGEEVPEGTEVGLVISLGKAEQNEENTQQPEEQVPEQTQSPEQTQPPVQNTKTKTYTVNPPAAGVTKAHIKIVKTDDNGESVVLDEQKSLPFSVPISGSGDGQITCYIDGVQMWSDAF